MPQVEAVIEANDAVGLVALATIREALQIPEADTGQDNFLANLAAQAASAVAADIEIPITPEVWQVPIAVTDRTAALELTDRYALDARAVRHVAAGAPAGAAATQDVAHWSQVNPIHDAEGNPLAEGALPFVSGRIVISPPSAGWPSDVITVAWRRGLQESDPALAAIRALVLQVAQRLWEAQPAIPSVERSIYARLSRPIRNRASLPDGATRL